MNTAMLLVVGLAGVGAYLYMHKKQGDGSGPLLDTGGSPIHQDVGARLLEHGQAGPMGLGPGWHSSNFPDTPENVNPASSIISDNYNKPEVPIIASPRYGNATRFGITTEGMCQCDGHQCCYKQHFDRRYGMQADTECTPILYGDQTSACDKILRLYNTRASMLQSHAAIAGKLRANSMLSVARLARTGLLS